ncbi:hypothetical protein PM082_015225 [Marasmius tenuissimus]|nr:hypothetical protein PM082_015225 [Marasmius tenuissimus]
MRDVKVNWAVVNDKFERRRWRHDGGCGQARTSGCADSGTIDARAQTLAKTTKSSKVQKMSRLFPDQVLDYRDNEERVGLLQNRRLFQTAALFGWTGHVLPAETTTANTETVSLSSPSTDIGTFLYGHSPPVLATSNASDSPHCSYLGDKCCLLRHFHKSWTCVSVAPNAIPSRFSSKILWSSSRMDDPVLD